MPWAPYGRFPWDRHNRVFVVLFSRYAWYRRWCGGHWEEWANDATKTEMWFLMDACSRPTDYRPPCCFGSPICEDHGPTRPGP